MENLVKPNNAPVRGINPKAATGVRTNTARSAVSKLSGPAGGTVTPNIVQASGQNKPNVMQQPTPNQNHNMPTAPKNTGVANAYNIGKQTLGKAASPTVGIREYAVGNGIDNNAIGWDGKNATIGSHSVTPRYVTGDGTAYGSQRDIDNAIEYFKNDDYIDKNNLQPVRSSLVNAGIPNDQIGYNTDTGYVTAYGRDVLKPAINNNGTTYAAADDLNEAYRTAYRNNSDDLVAVRDYVSQQGYGGAVDWDGENVTVGGKVVPYAYIKDGTAYVSRRAADNSINELRNGAGIHKADNIYADNYDRYGTAYDRLLDDMDNYGDFGYDLNNDTEFQNHSKYMQDLAADAYRSVLEKNNASANGASGAVLAEANNSLNSYLAQLADDATAYRDRAYNRYVDGYNRIANNLNSHMSVGTNDYNMAYGQSRDAISDRRSAAADEFERKQYEDTRPDTDLNRQLAIEQIRGYNLDNAGRSISNETAAAQYAMEQASNRNRFVPEDELYLPWLKYYRNDDGTYNIKPWEAEEQYNYDMAMAQQRAYYNAPKEYGW